LAYSDGMSHDAKGLERIALEVATEASRVVMQGFQQRFLISTKAHDELFTEFDVKSEELVRDALGRHTPGVAIVGEEHGGTPSPDDLTWYIDPIDGTINFIHGHPWFAISLGALYQGKPFVGAVVAPALNLTWSAARGHGARKNGAPCHVNSTAILSEAIVSTGFPGRRGIAARDAERKVAQHGLVCTHARDIRRCGSAAIELCMVADGTYGVYWTRHLPHWDTSAGACVVLEAGGQWYQLEEGTPAAADVATNGHLDAEFKQLLGSVG
jgi:myo-inositol-1(or 4)-monophosphatase